MPTITTRTLNPLPFEHLEPKRFEDLARQLAYDFKPWRQLEATGRTGSDDGFDARGFEIVPGGSPPEPDDEDAPVDEGATDRLWLIQCKRERAIGPTKMRAHLEAMPQESRQDLYGIIFVAACDFSKATRDKLRVWCAENSVSECHIWGKAELEDMLYQPKNDNLLFAYFGISLQIRRQKIATNLRRITTVKRKIRRLLDKNKETFQPLHFLFRDPSDDRFPFSEGISFKEGKFLWRVLKVHSLGLFGLRVITREHFAYLDRETNKWDVATAANLATPGDRFNPWYECEVSEAERKLETETRHFWLSLNERRMLTAYFMVDVPYEDIIEIDDVGNDQFKMTTIFITFRNGRIPYSNAPSPVIAKSDDLDFGVVLDGKPQNVCVFPDEFRDKKIEKMWAEQDEFSFSTEPYEFEFTPPPWLVQLREREAEEAAREADTQPKPEAE